MINTVKTNLLWLVCVIISSLSLSANDYTSAYIEQYKTIVLNEMDRVGIPASIKMAQAILESASGRSTLARQSMNHFGIKCGSEWTGPEVYRHDDDYKNGLLVRSCFRAFDDPAKSFIAHSDFLRNNQRYDFLFELDMYDYKSWARGLRKAGYATDPDYAKKLIILIEEHELYLLDLRINREGTDSLIAYTDDEMADESIPKNKKKDIRKPIVIRAIHSKNPLPKYTIRDGYYSFRKGDKMKDIATHFKMSVKELYFRNRLAYGATPKAGEKLAVKKYIHFKDIPNTIDPSMQMKADDFLFEENITISSL